MSSFTYTRFELLRVVRNRQNFLFSLAFPLVMYFLLATPNRGSNDFLESAGIDAAQYYMVGLLAFGTMIAVVSCGARIAAERQVGWNRQLRLSPLSARSYLRTKVITGYATAALSIALLYLCGIALGVRMPIGDWLEMTGLVLIALIPFAALGVAMGHLINSDAAGPAMGGGISLFAFLGGTWFPITGSGLFAQLCRLLPSYWLVQAGHVGLGAHNPWPAEAWIVVAAWSLAGFAFAGWAYRRDTKRA
jgi:ABC-2 type transport system permease protein